MSEILSDATVGQWLDPNCFPEIYRKITEDGERYFARRNRDGQIDLVIAFQDIDDFGESLGSQIMIDYQLHKDHFYLVVWTLTDPKNPLGFPIPFKLTEPDEIAKVKMIFEQDKVWIHYLATEDEQLMHIFSEAYQIPDTEKYKIPFMLPDNEGNKVNTEDVEEEILTQSADKLCNEQLLSEGVGYSFDFSSMIHKGDEDQANQKLMTALLQAVSMIKRHPRSEVRECTFLLWVGEKRQITRKGEDHRLLTIYMTPSLQEFFDVVHDDHQEENPLTTVLLGFPEFLITVEGKPVIQGAIPILEYREGDLIHLDLDNRILQRLQSLYPGEDENPYIQEG